MKCQRCDGCGKIANSERGEPWTVWENIPEESKMAIKLGVVKPLMCPDCNGSGEAFERRETGPMRSADVTNPEPEKTADQIAVEAVSSKVQQEVEDGWRRLASVETKPAKAAEIDAAEKAHWAGIQARIDRHADIRNQFAAAALTGILYGLHAQLASGVIFSEDTKIPGREEIAKVAFNHAEAMMAELAKRTKQEPLA